MGHGSTQQSPGIRTKSPSSVPQTRPFSPGTEVGAGWGSPAERRPGLEREHFAGVGVDSGPYPPAPPYASCVTRAKHGPPLTSAFSMTHETSGGQKQMWLGVQVDTGQRAATHPSHRTESAALSVWAGRAGRAARGRLLPRQTAQAPSGTGRHVKVIPRDNEIRKQTVISK